MYLQSDPLDVVWPSRTTHYQYASAMPTGHTDATGLLDTYTECVKKWGPEVCGPVDMRPDPAKPLPALCGFFPRLCKQMVDPGTERPANDDREPGEPGAGSQRGPDGPKSRVGIR